MAVKPYKYVSKPTYVDAIEVTAENLAEVSVWCRGDVRTEGHLVGEPEKPDVKYIKIPMYHPASVKLTKAYIGDFVVYSGTKFKVFTPKPFANTFEIVHGVEKAINAGTDNGQELQELLVTDEPLDGHIESGS